MKKLQVDLIPNRFGFVLEVGGKKYAGNRCYKYSGRDKLGRHGIFRWGFYWFWDGMTLPNQHYVLGDDGRYYEL